MGRIAATLFVSRIKETCFLHDLTKICCYFLLFTIYSILKTNYFIKYSENKTLKRKLLFSTLTVVRKNFCMFSSRNFVQIIVYNKTSDADEHP